MAHRLQHPQTPLTNTNINNRSIYGHNASTSARQAAPAPAAGVPTGACNFINLNIAGAGKCGCQRYFDKSVTLSGRYKDGQEAQVSYWCMCEHHACYHEVVPQPPPRQAERLPALEEPLAIMPSQKIQMMSIHGDTELPDTATGGRTSTVGCSAATSQAGWGHMKQSTARNNDLIALPVAQPLPQGLRATNRNTQRHESLHVPELPDIPSQCFLPSNVSSGSTPQASTNASFNLDPSANTRAINHLDSIHDWIPDPIQPYNFPESVTDCASLMSRHFENDIPPSFSAPQPQQHTTSAPAEQEQPVGTASRQSSRVTRSQTSQLRNTTLVIRPSSSQDENQHLNVQPNKMDLDSPSASSVDLRSILPHIPEIRDHYASKPSLKDKLREHDDRLEHLENQTHSVVCASERGGNCDCDCDLVASRVDNHDSRVGKIERALSARKFRGFAQLDNGDGEHSFVSEATTELSTGHQEMYNRVDSRLGDIENRMFKLDGHGSFIGPSAANPWKFEVVFLPFGAELAKVWSSADSFGSQMSRRSMSRKDSNRDLIGSQFTGNVEASASKFFSNAPRENSWENALEEAYDKSGVLSARAFNVDSIPDQRFRSRGLVRMVEIKGPDAQHAQFAIFEAFGDLVQKMADGPPNMPKLSSKVPKKLRRYKEALNSSWIPLRKLHKESKLQFLQTSEMMTSTSWSTSFLAEVAMNQAGRRRLFITSKESYIQAETNLLPGSGWTWESIRQLTPYDPEASQDEEERGYDFRLTPGSGKQQMAVAEPCWDHDDKLDGRKPVEPQLPDLSISATNQTTTTVPQSHLKFPLSVNDSFSINASFHSVEHDDASSSIADSSSSIASSPTPSETSLGYSPVPMQRKVSDSISPLTSRNAFENINISTRRRSRTNSRANSQTPGPSETPFGLEMARKRTNPYSSIFDDVTSRRSYPLSSSPAKATASANYLNIKRQRTRSPSKPRDSALGMRDTPRWSVGRSSPSPFIYEDRSRSNTRETTAGPANLHYAQQQQMEGEGKKRGLTPFAYGTPFSNAPPMNPHPQMARQNSVKVKRERSWGSAASGGLKNLQEWNAGGDTDEDGEEGYESEFFQPRQVTTPGGAWEGLVSDSEATLRQADVKPLTPARVSSSSFGAEAHALTDEGEDEGDEGEVSDTPSEYPSTQVQGGKVDKGKGVFKPSLVHSTERSVDVKGGVSKTFAIHED